MRSRPALRYTGVLALVEELGKGYASDGRTSISGGRKLN
jgi:hypothetical protein